MSIGNVKNGHRIKCNGVYGTVVGNRRTRNRRLVFVQMDNGFTLKLDARALSAGVTGDVTYFAPDAKGPDGHLVGLA
jgi:hypothetical protein